eukprot:471534_1
MRSWQISKRKFAISPQLKDLNSRSIKSEFTRKLCHRKQRRRETQKYYICLSAKLTMEVSNITRLMNALEIQDIDEIQEISKICESDVNTPDEKGRIALNVAA